MMEIDIPKENYYSDITCKCSLEPCDRIDQVTKCRIEITLEVIHGYKWGFLNDSSPPMLVSFAQTPVFDLLIDRFCYSLSSPDEIESTAYKCQEQLERYGVIHGRALELAEKFELKVDECVEDHYKCMEIDEKLSIRMCLGMVTVYDHDEYLQSRAIMESTMEWEFPVCPASEEAVKALYKFTVAAAQDESVCTVCTQEFVKGEEVLQMPCTHLFHSDCIIPWLKNMNTCPNCRIEI